VWLGMMVCLGRKADIEGVCFSPIVLKNVFLG
jgi:hypothetical protein